MMQVLKRHSAQGETIVKMDRLTEEDSWSLFCEHAFRGVDHVPKQLDETVVGLETHLSARRPE